MPRFLVIITDFVTGSLAAEKEILGDLADVVAANGFSEADLTDYLPTAAALMVYHNLSITRASIEKLAQCKVIVRCGVGIDNVDGRYARERGIPFVNVPDYGTEDVADSAIGMALALARGITQQNSQLRGASAPPRRCAPKRWEWTSCFTIRTCPMDAIKRWECGELNRLRTCSGNRTS